MKRIRAIVVLCLLGFTLFTMPAGSTAYEWQKERYPANVFAEGNMTLTNEPSFNITIQANFTAVVPSELTYGDYNASFEGKAHVCNKTIDFRGALTVNESKFYVSFRVPNIEITSIGEEGIEEDECRYCCHCNDYEASGELEITISQIFAVPPKKAWVRISGHVNSYGKQPAFGWLKAHAKVGEWARVHAFFMPSGWKWEPKPANTFHNANVTLEGNLTLTCMSESFDITIVADFTAKVPEEIGSESYTALFEGCAYVSQDTVRFTGLIKVDHHRFPVTFTIPNTYQDLPEGHLITGGDELMATITKFPVPHFKFALYKVRLVNAYIVELNYSGNDFYVSGLWDVYNITWTYSDKHCFNMTVRPVVVNGTGEFKVINRWKDFTLDIAGVELVSGKVFFLCCKSFMIPPGDVNNDYIVDIFDLVHAAKRYRTTPGIAEFDSDLDFNDDFEIDVYDLTTIGANLGGEY